MTLEEIITQIQESRAEDPRINDGIRHIIVKDLNTEYVLVDGEWQERIENELKAKSTRSS